MSILSQIRQFVKKSLCYNRAMETLSPNKFRRYFIIVVRVIWMGILVFVALRLITPIIWIINDAYPVKSVNRYAPFIISGACLVALLIIRNLYRLIGEVFSAVIIYKDILRDKYIRIVTYTDDNGNTHESRYYYLYFDQIFGRFKKQTEVSEKTYNDAVIGKEYYIGIVRGVQSRNVYAVDKYQLVPTAQHALVPDAKELERRTRWRWYAPEEQPVVNDGGVKRITPEQVVKDAYWYSTPAKEKSLSASRIISGVLVVLMVCVLFGAFPAVLALVGGINGLLLGVGIMLFSLLPFVALSFVFVRFFGRHERNCKKEILAGHYKVVLDKVAATEEHDMANFSYRKIHEQMPVRLESGHTVNLSRSKYNNVRPGDKLYIVYMETGSPFDDKSIIAVYQEKLGKLDFGFEVTWAS